MKNWTIGKRIIIGGSTLLALLLLIAGIAIVSLNHLKNTVEGRIANDTMPGVIYSGLLNNYLEDGFAQALLASQADNAAEREKCLKVVDEDVALTVTNGVLYEASITAIEDRHNFDEFKKFEVAYTDARLKYVELIKAGQAAEAKSLLLSKLQPAYQTYADQGTVLIEWNAKEGKIVCAQVISDAGHTTWTAGVVGAVSVIIAAILGFVITRSINRVLNRVSGSLNDGSAQVSSASGQVSAASQTLAEGSSEQASSLEETGSSLEEMSSMTKRNAENARKANDLAKEARTAADKGVGDMQTMAAAMEAIKVSSDDIAKIIKTIDEIAFQTNILALNAAVEAARAGEAGMGFAVVADEVRNLAQRCAQAAKETAGKIEGAIIKTGQGVEISSKVAAALNEIVNKVRQVDELVTEVAGATREQTDGIAQINVAVGQMDKVTQSNAATAEESAAAAEELNSQAEVMKRSVAELLQLVGGKSESTARKPTAAGRRIAQVHTAATAGKRTGLAGNNGSGNGRMYAGPGLATTAKRRNEIPLDGDFKDF